MKKLLSVLLIAVLTLTLFAGCGGTASNTSQSSPETNAPQEQDNTEPSDEAPTEQSAELSKIVIGASPAPHAEILEAVKETLAQQGYELEIREFTDYVQPNLALENGDIDANFFQHEPYLVDFNEENGTALVSIAGVHYEPLGIFPGKTSNLDDLADGAQVAVPNDTTNEARALLLLEAQGLITVNSEAGLSATINDITNNPKNLKIVEIEAAQLPRSLPDVDIAVINGNYALDAGLNAATDALAKEESESLAAQTYVNVLVVRAGDESREDLLALANALLSAESKSFIEDKYQGAVVPFF